MEPGLLSCIGLGWWATASAVQWASAALARSPRPEGTVHHRPADFSIVAPMNGAADASAATSQPCGWPAERDLLRDHADDGAVAATRAWPEAPILVGSTTFNRR